MKNYSTIELIIENRIATVWLNRPEVHNAINKKTLDELIKCFKFLEKSKEIRIIILRGNGKSFSSGADLKWMLESGNKSYKKNEVDSIALAKCLNTIYKSSKPTIAVLHGAVIGGAIGLLSTCDFAIAEVNTIFSLSELRMGLAPSTIMPYILTKMNQHNVKMLMLTGNKISADKAHQLGLIEQVFEKQEIEENLRLISADIMKSCPVAIKESKKLIRFLNNAEISKKIINRTVRSITKMKMSKDSNEGISAFLEKRLPKWAELD
jgi:methylglutaconyl-CoA hydratase